MIIDSEHFRNFIAMTLFLLAVKYLEDSSLSGNIKFVMMVLLAASVHTAFIFYLPFVFVHSRTEQTCQMDCYSNWNIDCCSNAQ